jgi:hypothetical protein
MNWKNKRDIIGSDIWKVEMDSLYFGWYEEHDDDCISNCNCSYCNYDYDEYEYLPVPEINWKIIKRIGYGYYSSLNRDIGRMVDMKTIYTKEFARQKKIDYLLGISKFDDFIKPTIGDILKNKDYNERC